MFSPCGHYSGCVDAPDGRCERRDTLEFVASESGKSTVFLLDAMSFIFRAYHAMQRSRPMSTRTGVPTAATYVFINMLNKLRGDFKPEYFAAVFDVSGPVFRDERARGMTVNKYSAETQKFEAVETGGYKAKREAMPPDLAQQLPYMRRALEAFRIPILEAEGFEADDVIGTMAAKAAKAGYPVFVVSNDKDMMQLVNDHVKILNPVKDNLVLDREKVIETLGVPPERVIDVMALRGDSIDNIPGAPGIGDKGSVELIQQFGSVEAALDRAEEIKRKTYRESLQNNREAVLLSKELVTIHCEVALDFDPEAMRTQEPDVAASRALFTELEFTTLLRDLTPAVPTTAVEYVLEPTAEQIAAFVKQARKEGLALALSASELEAAAEQVSEQEAEAIEEKEPELKTMSLLDLVEQAEAQCETPAAAECRIGVATTADTALMAPLDAVKELLEDAKVPKQVHDLKGALRVLESHGVTLRGATDDLMLYSYLINPTHATHRLGDVAARFGGGPPREEGDRALTEAARLVRALTKMLRDDVDALDERRVYEEIDLPLAPGAAGDGEGGRTDRFRDVVEDVGRAGEADAGASASRSIRSPDSGSTSTRRSSWAMCCSTRWDCHEPMKYGKGKVISTAAGCAGGAGGAQRRAARWCWNTGNWRS